MWQIIIIKTLAFFLIGLSSGSHAGDLPVVKVAVLKFGTANWELDVIKHNKLDIDNGFTLEVMEVASKNAASVALNANATDIIYGDWVWVNRQRHTGNAYKFSPTSSAAGGIYLQPDAAISSLNDFNGERFGIAGGSVDKSWLILQAYFKHRYGSDITSKLEPVYAAPPLINRLMEDNRLPAALNFWHYCARLEAAGFKRLLGVDDILNALGVENAPPFVGWIFNTNTSPIKSRSIAGFLRASQQARRILAESDKEWHRISPLIKADNDRIFSELKSQYRSGMVEIDTDSAIKSLLKIYAILVAEGGKDLTGGADTLDLDLFVWPENRSFTHADARPFSVMDAQ